MAPFRKVAAYLPYKGFAQNALSDIRKGRFAVEKAGKCPFYGTPPAVWEKFSKSFQIFLPFRAGNFRIAIEKFLPLP